MQRSANTKHITHINHGTLFADSRSSSEDKGTIASSSGSNCGTPIGYPATTFEVIPYDSKSEESSSNKLSESSSEDDFTEGVTKVISDAIIKLEPTPAIVTELVATGSNNRLVLIFLKIIK